MNERPSLGADTSDHFWVFRFPRGKAPFLLPSSREEATGQRFTGNNALSMRAATPTLRPARLGTL